MTSIILDMIEFRFLATGLRNSLSFIAGSLLLLEKHYHSKVCVCLSDNNQHLQLINVLVLPFFSGILHKGHVQLKPNHSVNTTVTLTWLGGFQFFWQTEFITCLEESNCEVYWSFNFRKITCIRIAMP